MYSVEWNILRSVTGLGDTWIKVVCHTVCGPLGQICLKHLPFLFLPTLPVHLYLSLPLLPFCSITFTKWKIFRVFFEDPRLCSHEF